MVGKQYNFTLRLLTLSILMSPLRSYGVFIAGFNFSLFRITGLLFIMSMFIAMVQYGDTQIYLPNAMKITALIWVLSLAAIVYSPSVSGSKSNYISVVYGFLWILCFCILAQKRDDVVISSLKALIYSAVFPMLLGEYQSIIYQFTGSVPSLPFNALVVSEGKLGMTYNVYMRITSCFGDPGYFSTCLVFVFAIALFFLQEKSVEIKGSFRILCVIELILSIVLTLQMMSFSGMLGIAVVVLGAIVLSRHPMKMFAVACAIMIATVAVIVGFQKVLGYDIMEGVIFKWQTQKVGNTELFGRSNYMLNAWNKFLDNPILGAGFGGVALGESYFSSAHNSLLTILGQQGIFVFLFYVLILLVIPIYKFFLSENIYSFSVKRIYLALFAVVILSLGYDTMFSLDMTYVVIGIIVVLSSGIGVDYNEEELSCYSSGGGI